MRGNRRRHRLHEVVDVVHAGCRNRPAQPLEPLHVQRDVVVNDEDRARAARSRVSDVRQHPLVAEGVEVPAAHLDDRTEAAVVSAAARRLDEIDLSSKERVPRQHAAGPLRETDLSRRQRRRAAVGGVAEAGLKRADETPGPAMLPGSRPCSIARTSSRNVSSPSPRTSQSMPSDGSSYISGARLGRSLRGRCGPTA